MNNKLKLAIITAATLVTASAAYAGPHHWLNWDNNDCPYADGTCPWGYDHPAHYGHGPRGFGPAAGPAAGPMAGPRGFGPAAADPDFGPGFGPGMGMRGGLESPYMQNLIEQAGLKQDYQHVLQLKDALFAKRQVLNAMLANSQNASDIEKAANDFTQARRGFRDATEVLFDKLYAKYPNGLPTPQSQANLPK